MRKGKKGSEVADKIAWEHVYDEYIEIFGLNKLYERMLKAMHKKTLAELDYVLTGDRFKLTEAEIQEQELKNLTDNKGNGMSIQQCLIHISKWIGYWLDMKKLNTHEYFLILQEFESFNKAQKEVNNG